MYKLIGYRPYSYDKDGKHYQGVTLHCINYAFEEQDNSVGQGVFSKSCSDDVFNRFINSCAEPIGLDIDIFYNQYGGIMKISEV